MPQLTLEGFITTFIYGLPLAAFIGLSTWLGTISLRWYFRFLRASRRQRRYDTFVEVRRRVNNEEYLLLKETGVIAMLAVLLFMLFMLTLTIAVEEFSPLNDELLSALLLLIFVFIGGLFGFFTLREASRNLAARSFRAGLKRDRRTKQFRWKPHNKAKVPF